MQYGKLFRGEAFFQKLYHKFIVVFTVIRREERNAAVRQAIRQAQFGTKSAEVAAAHEKFAVVFVGKKLHHRDAKALAAVFGTVYRVNMAKSLYLLDVGRVAIVMYFDDDVVVFAVAAHKQLAVARLGVLISVYDEV